MENESFSPTRIYRAIRSTTFVAADGFKFRVRHKVKEPPEKDGDGIVHFSEEQWEDIRGQRITWRQWSTRGDSVVEEILGARMKIPQLKTSKIRFAPFSIELPEDTKDQPKEHHVRALFKELRDRGHYDIAFVIAMQWVTGLYAEEVIGLHLGWDAKFAKKREGKVYGTKMADFVWMGYPGDSQLFVVARYSGDRPWKLVKIDPYWTPLLNERWFSLGGWRNDPSCPMALCSMSRYHGIVRPFGPGSLWSDAGAWWCHYNVISEMSREANESCSPSPVQPSMRSVNLPVREPVDVDKLTEAGLLPEVCERIVLIPEGEVYRPIGYADEEAHLTKSLWDEDWLWNRDSVMTAIKRHDGYSKAAVKAAFKNGRKMRLKRGKFKVPKEEKKDDGS